MVHQHHGTTPNGDKDAQLKSVELVGLPTFEKVAQEVANTFGKAVVICHREADAQNSELVPFINLFTDDPELNPNLIIKTVHPEAEQGPSVQQAVE